MENRCYNCAKFLSPDRTCISDGDCPEFDPGISDLEKELLIERLKADIPGIHFEMQGYTEGIEPVIRIENRE